MVVMRARTVERMSVIERWAMTGLQLHPKGRERVAKEERVSLDVIEKMKEPDTDGGMFRDQKKFLRSILVK